MGKVKIMQRSVYHKIAEIEVEVSDEVEVEDIQEWLQFNEELYVDKIDKALNEAPFEYGFGLGDAFDDDREESEWRFEYKVKDKYFGGHL
jgi:hypothetical protein